MVGILLVLTSVVLVTRIVAAADRSVRVWALVRDVSVGTTLADADLHPARVRLFESAPAYLQVSRSPAGRMVSRSLRAGELLPATALDSRPPGVIVSIPIKPENAPAVTRGQLIDVWSTTKGCPPVRVLGGIAVQEVRANGGGALSVSTGALQVIVRVRTDQAERVVAALGAEATIRLVVLDGSVPAGRPDGSVANDCLAAGPPGSFRRAAPAASAAAPAPAPAAAPGSASASGSGSGAQPPSTPSGSGGLGGSGGASSAAGPWHGPDQRPGRLGRPIAVVHAGGRR
jgi:hypothetical protein